MQLLQRERERIGRRIRQARIDSGLSHDKLAFRVGSSRQHLIKLEKGMHTPGDRLLQSIARETGKPLAFFEDDDGEEADLPVTLAEVLDQMVRKAVARQIGEPVA